MFKLVRRIKFGKPELFLGVLVLAIVPWGSGGKEPVVVLVDFFLLLLALVLVARWPNRIDFQGWRLAVAGMGFIGWSALSLIWSFNRYQTIKMVIVEILALAVFSLAYQFNGDWERLKQWSKGYAVAASGFSLLGVWLYATGDYNRLTSTFYWANPMAMWLMPSIVLSVWFYVTGGTRFFLITGCIVEAALILTDSRSAFLLLGLLALAVLIRIRMRADAWLRLLLIAVLGFGLALGVNYYRAKVSSLQVTAPGSRFAEAAKGESTSSKDRLYYLHSAWLIWRDYPLLGTGAGTFASVHPHYQLRVISAASNAHNFYVQTLAELGLPGFGLLVALVLLLLGGGWMRVKEDPRWWPVLIGLVALLIHLGLDIDSDYPVLVLLIATIAGLIYKPNLSASRTGSGRYVLVSLGGLVLIGLPAISLYQSQLQIVKAGFAQDDGDYAAAAAYDSKAHAGVAYNPDVISAEGINYYALARAGQDVKTNIGLAEDRAKAATKLDKYDAQQPFLLARSMRLAGDITGAEAVYHQTIKIDPYNNPDYYSDLAGLQLQQNRLDTAVASASDGLKLYGDDVVVNRAANIGLPSQVAELLLVRATAYLRLGESDLAKADIKHALKLDPANQAAHQMLIQDKSST